MTRELLAAGLADAQAACAPAGEELALVALGRLFKFARTFGIKMGAVDDATAFYLEALDDLPADLLVKAVDRIVRTYVYGHRLPPPGDLRASIRDELSRRHHARLQIRTALDLGRMAAPRHAPSEAERARALEMFEAARNALLGVRPSAAVRRPGE